MVRLLKTYLRISIIMLLFSHILHAESEKKRFNKKLRIFLHNVEMSKSKVPNPAKTSNHRPSKDNHPRRRYLKAKRPAKTGQAAFLPPNTTQ